MDGVSRYPWFRSARSPGVLLLALIVLLGVGGYVLTSTTIRGDRDDAAERRAQVEAVHAQEVLGRARAYVGGLSEVLAREPEPAQARFARWAGATSASVGLNDVLWVERVPASERRRYERLRGVPIAQLGGSGRLTRAPAADAYLPATFTSQTRPELRRGVDVSGFPALGDAIRNRSSIFAVGASRPGALGVEPGFYLLQAATFARGPGSRGYLVAFVPQGWFSTTLGGDPRRVAISEDGRRLEGQLDSVQASAPFEMLGRHWKVDVAREPASGLQSLLPWLALLWPFAVAGIAFVVARSISQRRRAQRDVERIFELSLDMICVAGFDGRFKVVNPAFERTLGYTAEQLLGRPFMDFVHPDDRQRTSEVFADTVRGDEVNQFENRYVCADGSVRWLQWSARVDPEQGLAYATARDVTERRQLVGEQEALRRVATLVAQDAPQAEVFGAIADSVAELFGTSDISMARYEADRSRTIVATSGTLGEVFPVGSRQSLGGRNAGTLVFDTGKPVRIDDYENATGPIAEAGRATGARSVVATPITVEGRLWGAITIGVTGNEPLPPETEARLGRLTDLMATAIANTESRAEVERLAEEQAGLRRVATLVAREASEGDVFATVTEEAARVVGTEAVGMLRFDPDGTATLVAQSHTPWEPPPLGTRIPLDGLNLVTSAYRTGKAARQDDWANATGAAAAMADTLGVRSSVATPIIVEGRLWGTMIATTSQSGPLPAATETRIGRFSDLVATAIANADARAEVERLAEEQAALRRVATLVAEGVERAELFSAVTREVAGLFADADPSLVPSIIRFDPGPEFVLVGAARPMLGLPVGSRWAPKDLYVSTRVLRTERSARVEGAEVEAADGPDAELLRSQGFLHQVGSPIVVEGRLWGAMTMNSADPLPADTAERLENFTELVATAVANTESREALGQLAEEQAALRRVATLVAEGAAPAAVLDAVSAEMEALLDADQVALNRFEPDDEIVVLAHRGLDAARTPVGSRVSIVGESATAEVARTGRPARIEDYEFAEGPLAELARATGLRSSVSAPIKVEGRLWGLITASWKSDQPPPADTEERMAKFAQLLDTAIVNADSRNQLTASRVRLLTAADDARRRVVRDLHDGAQQRLVHTIVTLKLAQRAFRDGGERAESLVGEALRHAEHGNAELRELAHGILPAVLTRGGLRAGVDAFVGRLELPVTVDVTRERFAGEIEASAYFIVAEALTNVVKHSHATRAGVCVSVDGGLLRVEVHDDGIGAADPDGHGLVGIADRAATLGGRLEVESPPGGGTVITATLPLSDGTSSGQSGGAVELRDELG